MRSLTYLAVLLLFLSCGKQVNVNQEFLLKLGKSAIVTLNNGEKITVKLEHVQESRCAPNVQCIWEGFVDVNVMVNQYNDTLGLLSSSHSSVISHGNYEVQLLEVNYPSDDDFGKQDKAKVKLKVVQ